jgi:uncharacterized protein (TIGR03083 family)
MALPNDQLGSGLLTELEGFEALVRSLDAGELATPSRCEGWTVGDVAAHVIGTMADVVAGRSDGLGSPEVTAREVDERRGRTGEELADELAGCRKAASDLLAVFDDAAWGSPAPGGYDGTLADGVEALWYDTYLHTDDINTALGRPTTVTDGLRASLSHVAFELGKRGWGPATLAFAGQPEFDVKGGGTKVEGDPHVFLLEATGRAEPTTFDVIDIYAT